MSKVKVFSVSQVKGGPKFEVKLNVGSTPSDPRWQELNLSDQDINDKAVQSVVIDLQGAMRRQWPKSQELAQSFVDSWAAGRRQSYAVRMSADDVQVHGFTEKQIAFLKSMGLQVETPAAVAESNEE